MQGNKAVIHVHSTYSVPAVEICAKLRGSLLTMGECARVREEPKLASDGRGMFEMARACSACAGDYEDPDRTAWALEESGEGEDESAPEPHAEEFPAEK